jgi:hypothetical protein
MKIIYLVLAHRKPEQLLRLINAIDADNSHFYVHIDLKADIHPFEVLSKKPNLHFITPRVDCIWGDFSIVQATINLMKQALLRHSDGVCVLLSGDDYPIKPQKDIQEFFKKNSNHAFIDLKEASAVWPEFYKRIEHYRFNLSSTRGDAVMVRGLNLPSIKHLLRGRITVYQFLKAAFVKRKLSVDLTYYGGSQWLALSIPVLRDVIDFIEKKFGVLHDFFKDSYVPDEFFFHSIIKQIHEEKKTFSLLPSVTYVNWSKPDVPLPVVFEKADIEELLTQPSDKLFARKFDIDRDTDVLDQIDLYRNKGI